MQNGSVQTIIGIGGWEHEVLDRCFYPVPGMESSRKLSFYAEHFDLVEVRASFWDDALGVRDVEAWIGAVGANRRFQFALKLHKSFTHKKTLTPKGTKWMRGLLHELARANRLAGLLAQFPYSFTNTGANRFHLVKIAELFSGFPLFVELRHTSWDNQALGELLAEYSVHAVNVDLPRLKGYMSSRSDAVGNTGCLRLHGRNEKGWLVNGLDTRYDYLYNPRELREISRRAENLSRKTSTLQILCNNTTHGKALANAFQLKSMLAGGKKLAIPAPTIRSFPFLDEVALSGTGQLTLPVFDQLREVV